MRKIFFSLLVCIVILGQTTLQLPAYAKNTYRPKTGHTYISGPKGGCYYINKNNNKTYVDRSLCK